MVESRNPFRKRKAYPMVLLALVAVTAVSVDTRPVEALETGPVCVYQDLSNELITAFLGAKNSGAEKVGAQSNAEASSDKGKLQKLVDLLTGALKTMFSLLLEVWCFIVTKIGFRCS